MFKKIYPPNQTQEKMNEKRCKGKTMNGKRCDAPAILSGYCMRHIPIPIRKRKRKKF